jgi:hypothetical protein
LASPWHTFGIRFYIKNNPMGNLNLNTLNLLKALDLELKNILLADLQAVRSKMAA